MGEVYIRLVKLPATVRGVTVADENGDYNIYINSLLSSDQQQLVLRHEMTHVRRDDFGSIDDIFDIEDMAP